MSDHDPTEPIDPTRAERPAGGTPPVDDPTSVMHQPARDRTTYETTTTQAPRQAPPAGGVSTGLAVAAALVVGLVGLLAGYLIWGGDDDEPDTATAVEDTVPAEEGVDEDLVAERDELAAQVDEQNARIDELEGQLEAVTAERDQLQQQVDDDSGDEVTTVPAPDVTGGTVSDAESAADENGWTVVEREVPADGEEEGTVVAQYPEPGTPMIEGSVLVVDVATDGGDE